MFRKASQEIPSAPLQEKSPNTRSEVWPRFAEKMALLAAMLAVLGGGVSAFASSTLAQDARQAEAAQGGPTIEQRVNRFIDLLDDRRKEQGVVGAAVVVAHGDRIVRSTGLGLRSLESNAPVTEDTVFALGSVTKQFTAMAVALTVAGGKMALDDHPRRFVPSFRLRDEEVDAQLNMIDLLAHRTGLERMDLAWVLAPFTQAELLQLASRAVPAAKLRERFLYNNVMYMLAGAAVAGAQGMEYERFVTDRLLAPLGMSASTFSLAGLTGSPDHAVGYTRAPATGQPEPIKPLNLASIAPAGALNSTARDMGAWLRFLNTGGRIKGEAKVAPTIFARLFEPHQVLGAGAYGLGFFLERRADEQLAFHDGNVDGYTAMVGFVPARGLSFAVLTNQHFSQLGEIACALFWETVVRPELSTPPTPSAVTPAGATGPSWEKPTTQRIELERLAGQYFSLEVPPVEIRRVGGELIAVFTDQPPYRLKETSPNTFNLTGLNGFSITFAELSNWPGRIAALLRQPPTHPVGNVPLLRRDDAWLARAKEQHSGPGKELIGSYRSDDQTLTLEIAPYAKGVALIVAGQQPWPLQEIGSDLYHLGGLAETFQIRIRRSQSGGIFGITLIQPNFRADLALTTPTSASSADEARKVLEQAVAAAGGEEALNRISSLHAVGRTSAPQHGFDGRFEDTIASNQQSTLFELGAFGKTVFSVRLITTDEQMVVVVRDGERFQQTGIGLRTSRFYAVPHPLYRWKERFPTVTLAGETTINGDDAVIIELRPSDLEPTRLSISKATFMILREEKPDYLGDELQPVADVTDYSDYRPVDGVQMPFSASSQVIDVGQIILTYDLVALSVPVDPSKFAVSLAK
jgi:CubicO group peptidase (beta-lactamase class C family)